ncbi:MAG TPA: Uma2 family endonuclease [Kofleriaceae bacterium]|nr:Uma2 family endonuclease [Kofleriaceae bacterium]
MAPAKKPATYADIEALPEHLVGEIINGELVVSPRPRLQHGVASGEISYHLDHHFGRGRGGAARWFFIIEPELHLGTDVVVPDVAGWCRERAPTEAEAVGITIVPDWVCEILSPSTLRIDRSKKMAIYARASVNHLWLVDPMGRTIEAFRRLDDSWVLIGVWTDEAAARIEPFSEIELDVSRWWLPPQPGSANEPPATWSTGP